LCVAVAFSCVALSAVPSVIGAGVGQVITGVTSETGTTSIITVLLAVVYTALLVGVNTTDNCCPLPNPNTVPDEGVYTNVPATGLPLCVAVAFNCVELNAVPTGIGDGVAQVITGVTSGITSIVTVMLAVVNTALLVGVNTTDSCCPLPDGKTVPDGGV
jgi:hypothetical protein